MHLLCNYNCTNNVEIILNIKLWIQKYEKMEILKWYCTLNIILKLPVGGSKWLLISESLNHSLNWFIQKQNSCQCVAQRCTTPLEDAQPKIKVLNVTRAGRESRNAHGQILNYRLKKVTKNVDFGQISGFQKMSSLSPRLAIPMLQIVIKHLKWSLFACFLRGLPFSLLASRSAADWHTNHAHKCAPTSTPSQYIHIPYTQNYSI